VEAQGHRLYFRRDDRRHRLALRRRSRPGGARQGRGAGVGAVRWRIFTHAETADRLFVEGVDEYDTPNGKTIIAPYCGVIEFRGDKISGWRDYVDRSVIDDQKAGKAVPAQITELVSRPVAR
jgi:ketosteroid isomerase-like protein